MWRIKHDLALIVLTCIVCSSQAIQSGDKPHLKTSRSDDTRVHDVGDLFLAVSNLGVIGDPSGGGPSALWPGESGNEHLFQAGLWIGAMVSGNPYVSTSQPYFEWRPGIDPVYSIYSMANGDPGGNRYPHPEYDDDEDLLENEDPKDGFDNDADGIFDEDYRAISDQMYRCTFRDYLPECFGYSPDHHALNLFVTRKSYQWQSEEYRDFVGIEYDFKNVGEQTLEDLFFGYFADFDIHISDIRESTDDLVGHFSGEATAHDGSLVWLETAYMYDTPEEDSSYIGVVFLDHTTDPTGETAPLAASISSIQIFRGDASWEEGGDPDNDLQRYTALSTTSSDIPPSTPDDYRLLVSVGPFPVVAAGDSISCSFAMVAGGDWEDYLSNAANAVECYRGKAYDRDGDPETGENGKEHIVHWNPDETGVVIDGDLVLSPDGSGDVPNIQAALDSIAVGSTVFLLDGVYSGEGNRDLDFHGNAIGVVSLSGNPDSCIIDCQGTELEPHRGFIFRSSESSEAIIQGLSIINGYGEEGGAIKCENGSSPRVRNCILRDNYGTSGGAIYCDSSSPVFENCSISYNSSLIAGAAFLLYSDPTIENCILSHSIGGPAVFGYESNPFLSCTDVVWNEGGDWVGCIADQQNQNGNFSNTPAFCNPEDGDLRLQPGSPCLPEHNDCGVLVGALGEGACAPTGVDELPNDARVKLSAYPNPFNPHLTIRFSLPAQAEGRLVVHDVSGRKVCLLGKGMFAKGASEIVWNGQDDHGHDAASGVYFVCLLTDEYQESKKVVLLR